MRTASNSQTIILLRHGLTQNNLEHRYLGSTDLPLCSEGVERLGRGSASAYSGPVYVSPMRRARQTASLLFPAAEQIPIEDFREMDFGAFEGKTAKEMSRMAAYQAWVESGCEAACPGGESKAAFSLRTRLAFAQLMKKTAVSPVVIVAHGGTLMAILSFYASPSREYWQWHAACGEGFQGIWKNETLCQWTPFSP